MMTKNHISTENIIFSTLFKASHRSAQLVFLLRPQVWKNRNIRWLQPLRGLGALYDITNRISRIFDYFLRSNASV